MPLRSSSVSWFVRLLVAVAVVVGLRGQCNPQWLPGDPIVSPRGSIFAMTSWDPDGAGPAAPVLVVGGSFAVANEMGVRVATYDGSQWQRLGGPLPSACFAFTIYNSQLIAVCAATVHAWNGSAWQTIGTAVTSSNLTAATVFQGDLVVAGSMTSINGAPVANIARWNGTSWFALGAGTNGFVQALASYQYGAGPGLYVGGNFTTAGGLASPNLAVWTGSAWAAVAGPNGAVYSLGVRTTAAASSSFLFVGGSFTQAGPVAALGVARFNSASGWAAMSLATTPGQPPRLFVRAVGPTGFECVATVDGSLQRWTGSGWNLLGSNPVFAGADQLTCGYHAGRYHAVERTGATQVASFDGTAWQRVSGAGIDGQVHAVLAVDDEAVIAGDFRTISGVTMNGIARGDSNAWTPLAAGVTGGTGTVHALARLPDGRIVAGGDFSLAQGAVANRLAVWDGVAWAPLGGGTNAAVFALHVLPNGDLLVGGDFTLAGTIAAARVARWNGVGWATYGSGITSGSVRTLLAVGADVLAGGSFLSYTGFAGFGPAAYNIARFSGGVWERLGSGTDAMVRAAIAAQFGEVLVVGDFSTTDGTTARRLARLAGGAFALGPYPTPQAAPLSGVEVAGLLELPNRGLLVGGKLFTVPGVLGGSTQSDGVQRYDPSTGLWTPLVVALGEGRTAFALAANGDVLCTNTVTVGGLVSSGFARLQITCPATATSYGTACPGAGGALTLRATSLPWLRSTYRAETTGFASNMVGLAGMGFAPVAVPLPLLVPGSGPCDLLVDPVLLTPVLPVGGVGVHAVPMPTSIAFVGASLFEQVVALAFAPDVSISGLHGSNGLQLTLGAVY